MSNYDLNDAAYAEFEKEALRDDRVGKHNFLVTMVEHNTWPSGDPFIRVRGVLQTANGAKADVTLSEPPSPEVLKAEGKTYEKGKQRGIASNLTMLRQLRTHYSKNPDQLSEGDVLGVECVKNKEGFIRIVAFLPKRTDPIDGPGKNYGDSPNF